MAKRSEYGLAYTITTWIVFFACSGFGLVRDAISLLLVSADCIWRAYALIASPLLV